MRLVELGWQSTAGIGLTSPMCLCCVTGFDRLRPRAAWDSFALLGLIGTGMPFVRWARVHRGAMEMVAFVGSGCCWLGLSGLGLDGLGLAEIG